MLSLPAPTPLNGTLLEGQLGASGMSTRVTLVGERIELEGLNESDRATAQRVLDAHPPTAQAEAQRMAGERTNESTIRQQAETALANNRTFLAIASLTNAQLAAQVKALTRQNNGLIRLVLNRFDGTD